MSKMLAGRYELIEKIGEGGMAVVYKSKDRLLNRYVAIKILRPEYTSDNQFVDSFKRESQSAAGLQHPNIVAIYDVGKSGSINYIVMELIDGRPLSEIIEEKGSLDYKTVIDIAKQMAQALSLAHKHDIIHRDVKPHNILITKDGTAKLTDFGIAKAVSNSTMVAETSKIIGSVHYFSPEQARGSYVDARTDIYSLGIVIYEMLTGRVPFDGETPIEVALKHINQEIVPPSKLAKNIPPALEKIVMQATDKFQTSRYASADAMLEDLTNLEFLSNMVGDKVLAGARTGSSVALKEEESTENVPVNNIKDKESDSDMRNKKGMKNINEDKKKNKKLFLGLGIGAGVLLLLGIIAVVFLLGSPEEVKVPDLKGMTYEEAKLVLQEEGLNIDKEEEAVASEEIEEGHIVSQSPISGMKVKKGRTITVILSAGNIEIKAPDLSGKTYEEAKELLKAMGLEIVKGESVNSDEFKKNEIADQFPKPGTELEKGDIITVNISKGEGEGIVPKLVDKEFTDEDAINAILESHGYELGSISYEETRSNPPGIIISQNPAAGETAKKGTKIDIVISKKKSTEIIPNLTGMSVSEAQSTLEAAGFYLGNVTPETVEDSSQVDKIQRQYPNPDSEYEPGSTVDVWVGEAASATIVTVPNVLGYAEQSAIDLLESQGFSVVIDTMTAQDPEQIGVVLQQSLNAGDMVEEGAQILLWIGQ